MHRRTGAMMPTKRSTARRRQACTALLTGLLVLLPGAPALAHGGGDSEQSRVLVLDALTYMANRPAGYMDAVTDKVGDALEAPDTTGVNLAKVESARQALERNDMMQTRALLQASLAPMAGPVTGEDPGTTTMLDPLTVHTTWAGSEAVLAALSLGAALTGLVLARRWRPDVSLRALRTRSHEGGTR